jgi:hypothetical protein
MLASEIYGSDPVTIKNKITPIENISTYSPRYDLLSNTSGA